MTREEEDAVIKGTLVVLEKIIELQDEVKVLREKLIERNMVIF